MVAAENPGNRIVQGGELILVPSQLEQAIASSAAGPRPAQQNPAGAFPEVDMTALNDSLIAYLMNAAKTRIDNSGEVEWKNLLSSPIVEKVVRKLGHSFFAISDIKYVDSRVHQVGFLTGILSLSAEIPLDAFKDGVGALLGDDNVDYFLQEFGDRIGITDETKTIDTRKPETQRYLPGFRELNEISGRYLVMKDPYLLLLTLDNEDRKYVALFFNEARNANLAYPFHPSIMFDLNNLGRNHYVEANSYAITTPEINHITSEPGIIPFIDLVKMGKKYNIRGLAGCVDRLEKFREALTKIPTS